MDEDKWVSDMYFAATLLSYGKNIQEIDRSDGRRQKFLFTGVVQYVILMNEDGKVSVENNVSLDSVEMHYISRSLCYPPSYVDCLRNIKTAIHME